MKLKAMSLKGKSKFNVRRPSREKIETSTKEITKGNMNAVLGHC